MRLIMDNEPSSTNTCLWQASEMYLIKQHVLLVRLMAASHWSEDFCVGRIGLQLSMWLLGPDEGQVCGRKRCIVAHEPSMLQSPAE